MVLRAKKKTFTPKKFEEKTTKGEKASWFTYELLSGCLGVGCAIPILVTLILGLIVWLL